MPWHQKKSSQNHTILIAFLMSNEHHQPNPSHEAQHDSHEAQHDATSALSMPEALAEIEQVINQGDVIGQAGRYAKLKAHVLQLMHHELESQKHQFEIEHPTEKFEAVHPLQNKFNQLQSLFKSMYEAQQHDQEAIYAENLQKRLAIIEQLKALYAPSGTAKNLFGAIRAIKEAWQNIGPVAKAEVKNLYNNYHHHLNQFYQMLELNKEYRELEYQHNLEKRQLIIHRAEQLLAENFIQKALNELQYLHKLWKEEAEPVAEEHRESTWLRFKDISNQIHERKNLLVAEQEGLQQQCLLRKNEIIAQIIALSDINDKKNHKAWQDGMKTIDGLRAEFIGMGSVPKKLSNQNWLAFKNALRGFNSAKNLFFKQLKNVQIDNLNAKLELIKIADENKDTQDWDLAVPMYKKLQNDWQKIGHVPRSQADKIWHDFKAACNHFFDAYRQSNATDAQDWQENYQQKEALMAQLEAVQQQENGLEIINQIKNDWNAIGKVPKDKLAINTSFNKLLKEKLRLNKLSEFELQDGNLSENQKVEKLIKIKNSMTDLQAQIIQLENNLAFFSNPSESNPLLKDTYEKIAEKKADLEQQQQLLQKLRD
jgi:Domain of Unknown Function (DUF349)